MKSRFAFLHWLPMGKIAILNVLPVLFLTACVYLFVPASDRPVFWLFIAAVSIFWAFVMWGAAFLLALLTAVCTRIAAALRRLSGGGRRGNREDGEENGA